MKIKEAAELRERCIKVMNGTSQEMTPREASIRYDHAQGILSWASEADVAEYYRSLRYCAACGEPEGSAYAKRCCTDDQMIED